MAIKATKAHRVQNTDNEGNITEAAADSAEFTKLTDGTEIALITSGGSQNVLDDNSAAILADTTSIDGKITACNTGAVVVSSGTITANLGTTDNTVLDNIDTSLNNIEAGIAAEDSALGSGILIQGDDGTDMRMYIDKKLQSTIPTLLSPVVYSGTGGFIIGRSSVGFNGSCARASMYDYVKTNDEINQSCASDLYKSNNTHWYFASNQTNLLEGEYNYQIFANDAESDYRIVTYSTIETFIIPAAAFVVVIFAAAAAASRRVRRGIGGFYNRRLRRW